MSHPVLSVSEVTVYLKEVIETDLLLEDVFVSGEISNLKYYAVGKHYYFTLSDPVAQLQCVIYSTFIPAIKFKLEEGLKVLVRGKMKVFQKKGTFSFQVVYMSLQGVGAQSKAFEELKNKLLKEGLLDLSRKKSLPPFVSHVALVTAFDSAAMWDFVTVSRQWAPSLKITVIPTIMQGMDCPASVLESLARVYRLDVDIVVITRGGGSAEDLAGFNNEQVVRAIAACPIPTISALGHEVDTTLTDLVSDLRMPTPTAAAQHISFPWTELQKQVKRLLVACVDHIELLFSKETHKVISAIHFIQTHVTELHLKKRTDLGRLLSRLHVSNPLHKLRQGYSISRLKETGEIIKKMAQVSPGDLIQTEVLEGVFESQVICHD